MSIVHSKLACFAAGLTVCLGAAHHAAATPPAGTYTTSERYRTPWSPASLPVPLPPPESAVGPNPKLLALDQSYYRNTYVAANIGRQPSGQSIAVFKYARDINPGTIDPGFTAIWPPHYDSEYAGNFYPVAIAVDTYLTSPVIFVTGFGPGPASAGGSGRDIYTIAFGGDGSVLWKARYDYKGMDDTPVALVLGDKSVFVAATGIQQSGESDIIVLRYDRVTGGGHSETPLHVEVFSAGEGVPERAADMLGANLYVRNDTGEGFSHLIVLGTSTDFPGTGDNFVTFALELRSLSDPNPNEYDYAWGTGVNRARYYDNRGDDVAVCLSGNGYAPSLQGYPSGPTVVYAAGSSDGFHRGRVDRDYAVVAYDAATGDLHWHALPSGAVRWDGGFGHDLPRRVWGYESSYGGTYPKNYVYVTGGSWGGVTGYDSVTIAIDVYGDEATGYAKVVNDDAWPYRISNMGDDFGEDVFAEYAFSGNDLDGIIDPDNGGVYVLSTVNAPGAMGTAVQVDRLNRFLTPGRPTQPLWSQLIDTPVPDRGVCLVRSENACAIPSSVPGWEKSVRSMFVCFRSGSMSSATYALGTAQIIQCYDGFTCGIAQPCP